MNAEHDRLDVQNTMAESLEDAKQVAVYLCLSVACRTSEKTNVHPSVSSSSKQRQNTNEFPNLESKPWLV